MLDLDGNVEYAGVIYDSPSGAAKTIALDWKAVNGWAFWRFFDEQSKLWLKISDLRK